MGIKILTSIIQFGYVSLVIALFGNVTLRYLGLWHVKAEDQNAAAVFAIICGATLGPLFQLAH